MNNNANSKMKMLLLAALGGSVLLLPAYAQTTTRNGQAYGWTEQEAPVSPENIDRPLTELERLSLSPSGSGFAQAIYNVVSDNPLVPVTVTLRALDKITARFTDLTITIGEAKDFGKLRILARTCNKRPPEEEPETSAFLEIIDLDALERVKTAEAEALAAAAEEEEIVSDTISEPVEEVTGEPAPVEAEAEDDTSALLGFNQVPAIFRGWMFASSPALNAVDHPVYDVWVIDCKMVEPSE